MGRTRTFGGRTNSLRSDKARQFLRAFTHWARRQASERPKGTGQGFGKFNWKTERRCLFIKSCFRQKCLNIQQPQYSTGASLTYSLLPTFSYLLLDKGGFRRDWIFLRMALFSGYNPCLVRQDRCAGVIHSSFPVGRLHLKYFGERAPRF